MNNPRFSSLIYRIIGQPERWHDDYLGLMNQILDETASFDDPENLSELKLGEQIISRLHSSNDALAAFSTLLDKSMFKLIILDKDLTPIYHNQIANELLEYLCSPDDDEKLSATVLEMIRSTPLAETSNTLRTLDYTDNHGDHIYLRTIYGEAVSDETPLSFYLLLVPDKSRTKKPLNESLIDQFELTIKEQNVLAKLIDGKSIREIAEQSFVSENTVKTHLKSIYRKTGTNSQTDVIRLVLLHESRVLDSYFDSTTQLPPRAQKISKEDKQLILSDGSQIVYREYGPADGRPLVMFHSGYGCRLSVPYNHAEVLNRTNRRLIIADRPGFGKSPFVKRHPIGWNPRMEEFIETLDLTHYDILGSVVGCHMAISFAASVKNKPGKIILTSPVVINTRESTQHLLGILAPAARLVRASKRFARELYELWLKSVSLNISTHYRKMLDSSVGSKEKAIFAENNTLDLIVECFREGSAISLKGISHELVHCMQPLELDLEKITQPVELWYGSEDGRIDLEGVKLLAAEFPHSKLHIRDGFSEHIFYALFEEIVA